MNNRILAMLLAFVMLISIVPVNALAAEECTCPVKHVHDASCGYAEPGNCACNGTIILHSWPENMGGISTPCTYAEGSPCTHECTTTPVEHTHVDSGKNGVCDVDGCTEHVHVITEVAAVAPTCTAQGNLAYYKCTVETCGKVFKDAEGAQEGRESDYILNPKHSDLQTFEEKAATCNEIGRTAFTWCSVCQKYYGDAAATTEITYDDTVIPAKGHSEAWDTTETTHTYVCPDCGVTHWATEDHSFTYTDRGDGKHNAVCSECGYTQAIEHIDRDDGGNCVCDYCDAQLEHTLKNPDVYPSNKEQHRQFCTVCKQSLNLTAHTYEYTAEEYGTDQHIAKCSVCMYSKTPSCVDKNGDCKCDDCGALMTHEHDELSYIKEVPATCTNEGTKAHYKCEACGNIFSYSEGKGYLPISADILVIPVTGHVVDKTQFSNKDESGHWRHCHNGCGEKVDFAAHTEGEWFDYASMPGYHAKKCTECTLTLTYEEHEYTFTSNENGVSHKAECKECGKIRETAGCDDKNNDCLCDDCGFLLKHEIGDLSTVWEKDATCNTTGLLRHYQCPTCQRLFDINCNEITLESVTTDKLQHKWWPKGMDLSGTLHSEQCEYCKVIRFLSHKDEDGDCLCDYEGCDVLAHDHIAVHVPAKEATCVEEGTQEYWYYEACGKLFSDAACTQPLTHVLVYGKTAHTWGDWTGCADGENHERECEVCGAAETAEHVYGNEDVYCDSCGAAAGLTHYAEVPATCQQAGVKEHWKSDITGRSYWDAAGTLHITDISALQIPRLDHEMAVESGNGRTHTLVCGYGCGHTLNRDCVTNDDNCFCDVCGTVMSGHALEDVDFIAPACTTEGQRSAYYCAACDKYYDRVNGREITSLVIPALGHRWGSYWKVNSVDETYEKTCLNGCGEILVHEHSMVLEDTLKGNLHQWVCDCGYTKTEIHYDNDGDTACDECGHDMANKPLKVEQHSSETVTVGDRTTANNHNTWWQDWWEHLFPGNVGQDGMENVDTSSDPKANEETGRKNTITASGNTGSQSGNQSVGSGSVSEDVETEQKVDAITSLIQWLSNLLNSLRNG